MPFTDEKQHSYMEQHLPLLAESWSTPVEGLGGGGGAGRRQASLRPRTDLGHDPSFRWEGNKAIHRSARQLPQTRPDATDDSEETH